MRPIYIISPVSSGECPTPALRSRTCHFGSYCTHVDKPRCPIKREWLNRGIFQDAVHAVITAGGTPIAPQWLAFHDYLDDSDPEERKAGRQIGEGLMRLIGVYAVHRRECDSVCSACPVDVTNVCGTPQAWVFGWTATPQDTRIHEVDGHYVSEGMKAEIELARELEVNIVWMGARDGDSFR